MNIFVLFLLGYLLYRFIGGFLIPLFRASNQMRNQFRNMNGQANGQPNHSEPSSQAHTQSEAPKTGKVGEYIEFEEIH